MTAYEQGFLAKCAEPGFREALSSKAEVAKANLEALARRARGAFRYHNMTDPGFLATLGGLGAGSILVGNALDPTDKQTSRAKRILLGAAGTGLIGGGMYLAHRDDVRSAIRNAVFDFLGRRGEKLGPWDPSNS